MKLSIFCVLPQAFQTFCLNTNSLFSTQNIIFFFCYSLNYLTPKDPCVKTLVARVILLCCGLLEGGIL